VTTHTPKTYIQSALLIKIQFSAEKDGDEQDPTSTGAGDAGQCPIFGIGAGGESDGVHYFLDKLVNRGLSTSLSTTFWTGK
jgi:hypothetical protein